LDSSVLRWPESAEVLRALSRWASEQFERRATLRRLGYFGSHARGEAAVGSDLDLIAIVSSDDRPFVRRPIDWDTESLPVPVDLLVYTEREWAKLLEGGGRFAETLRREVRWLPRRPASE
jgi:predicted nucleotidyltransferase